MSDKGVIAVIYLPLCLMWQNYTFLTVTKIFCQICDVVSLRPQFMCPLLVWLINHSINIVFIITCMHFQMRSELVIIFRNNKYSATYVKFHFKRKFDASPLIAGKVKRYISSCLHTLIPTLCWNSTHEVLVSLRYVSVLQVRQRSEFHELTLTVSSSPPVLWRATLCITFLHEGTFLLDLTQWDVSVWKEV